MRYQHGMQIDVHTLPPAATNAYLLRDNARGEAVLIDAPYGAAEAVMPALDADGVALVAVLLTHAHFDHVLGASAFNHLGVPLYLHPDDREMLKRLPEQMRWFGLPGEVAVPVIDHWLGSEPLTLLGRQIEVRHTPGHCPGNVTFCLADERAAFVGDVVFAGSYGRTDLPGGDLNVLRRSFREQICTLPGETTIYAGHGPTTTVAIEQQSNPLNASTRDL